jgi:hypothetical protein
MSMSKFLGDFCRFIFFVMGKSEKRSIKTPKNKIIKKQKRGYLNCAIH